MCFSLLSQKKETNKHKFPQYRYVTYNSFNSTRTQRTGCLINLGPQMAQSRDQDPMLGLIWVEYVQLHLLHKMCIFYRRSITVRSFSKQANMPAYKHIFIGRHLITILVYMG